MAAQGISERGDDFKNIFRSQSSQASQEMLTRPSLVSDSGGLWYTPHGQCGLEEGYRVLSCSLTCVILVVFKSSSSGVFNTMDTRRAQGS